MANWKDVLSKVQAIGSAHDVVRREAIKTLADVTGRNVIVYYSGWLQKPELAKRGVLGFDINDSDKNGFMATINGLDRTKGLDLVLHTPGGEIAAPSLWFTISVRCSKRIFGPSCRKSPCPRAR